MPQKKDPAYLEGGFINDRSGEATRKARARRWTVPMPPPKAKSPASKRSGNPTMKKFTP